MEFQFNYLAILVASLSGFVLGGLWYGPLFGKAWMAASGITEDDVKKTNFAKVYGVTFLMNVIAAYVLAHAILAFGYALPDVTGVMAGVQGGFWTWLGYVLTVRVTEAMFERTNKRVVLISLGYRLVWLIVMGIIISVWR